MIFFLYRLFKNAFQIKNTPADTAKTRPKARRLLGMASRHFPSPEPVSPSTDKENNTSDCSPHGTTLQEVRYTFLSFLLFSFLFSSPSPLLSFALISFSKITCKRYKRHLLFRCSRGREREKRGKKRKKI